MWEWILQELRDVVKVKSLNKELPLDKEDIVSNVILKLCQTPEMAEHIYTQKSRGLLKSLVKAELYEQQSKLCMSSKAQRSRYEAIKKVCQKYNIDPLPKNAYKISEILNSEKKTKDYSISRVINVLSPNSPLLQNNKCQSLEEIKQITIRG